MGEVEAGVEGVGAAGVEHYPQVNLMAQKAEVAGEGEEVEVGMILHRPTLREEVVNFVKGVQDCFPTREGACLWQ